MMNTEQRKLLEELFHQASEMKDRAERAFFVARRACGEDRELKTQLQRMLQANDGSSVFIDSEAKLATTCQSQFRRLKICEHFQSFLKYQIIPKVLGGSGSTRFWEELEKVVWDWCSEPSILSYTAKLQLKFRFHLRHLVKLNWQDLSPKLGPLLSWINDPIRTRCEYTTLK